MSQLYKNNIKFNNGISPVGAFPLNDTEIWGKWSDLFVSAENPRLAPMFNKVYAGMTVKIVVDGDVKVLTCKNAEPYKPGAVLDADVDDSNVRDFWRVETEEVQKLADAIDSINISSNSNHNFYPSEEVRNEVGASETINSIGSIPAGTTLDDLRGVSLSDVIYKMLFECALPVFVDGSENKVLSNIAAFELEVGTVKPDASAFDLENAFVSESYQWVSNANPATKGPVTPLNEVKEISVKFVEDIDVAAGVNVYGASDEDAPVVDVETVTEGVDYDGTLQGVYGLNGVYYINVIAGAGEPAKDSNGNPCENPVGLTENTEFNSVAVPLYGFHKLYHNAAVEFASAQDAADARDIDPEIWDPSINRHVASAKLASDHLGINDGEFSTDKFYLQWPKGVNPSETQFEVFISKNLEIKSVNSCSDMTGKFNVPVSFDGPFRMDREEFILSEFIEKVTDHPLPEGSDEDDIDSSCHIPHVPYDMIPLLEDELVDDKNFIETHRKYLIKSDNVERIYDGITTVEITLGKMEDIPV